MSENPSRRAVLLSLTTAAPVGLAGCSLISSSDDEKSIGCTSFGFSNTRTDPLSDVSVVPERGDFEHVLLEVSLDKSSLDESDAAAINVYNPYDEVENPRFTIPLAQDGEAISDGVREESGEDIIKRTRIGTAPMTGEFRVAVEDSAGSELAAERFSFDCERSSSSEGRS